MAPKITGQLNDHHDNLKSAKKYSLRRLTELDFIVELPSKTTVFKHNMEERLE